MAVYQMFSFNGRLNDMKVIFAASTFPRWRGDDIPDFVWHQVRHISKLHPKMESIVLAPHDRGAPRSETWENVRIRRFRYFFPASLQKLVYPAIWPNIERAPWLFLQVPFLLLAQFLASWRLIRREKPDLVYSHWFVPQGIACGLAALLTGTPHAFTSHSQDVAVLHKLPLIGVPIVRFFVRKSLAITVVSRHSERALKSFFESDSWPEVEGKVEILPMGVDVEEWSRRLSEVTRAPDPLRSWTETTEILLFVGRLAEKKGVHFLLSALASETLRSRDVLLVVAGDGPWRDTLHERAERLGIRDRVHFPGYVTGSRKAAYFKAADVVVIPSIVTLDGDAEGMPVVLLEALAAGKICVATDASNAPEILTPGEDGFLVPEKDSEALASSIVHALSLSPAEKQSISDRARRKAKEFDWPVIARRHIDHLFPPT